MKADTYVSDGVPVVRGSNIGDTRALRGDFVHIPETLAATMPSALLQQRDLFFPHRGAIGEVGIIENCRHRYMLSTSLMKLTPNPDVAYSRFLFYFFRSARGRHELLRNASQVGTPGIATPLTSLRKITVPLPPLRTQQAIATILCALDDRIDSNRRLVALLEETAAAIFKVRFVDFVGVEEFEESGIRRVPKGWAVAPVGETLKVVGGGTPSTKEPRYWEEGTHCWATPKDLAGNRSSILLDTDRHITDEGVRRISSKLLPVRTVLLSSRAPVGYTAVSFVPIAVNQGFIAIPPSDGLPSEFVLFWLREHMDEIKAAAGGTTFAEISKRQFRPLPIVVPPREVLDEFARAVHSTFDLMAAQETEVHTLTQLRDALLPKLVSGEIRVSDTADPNEVIGLAAEQSWRLRNE